MTASPEPTTPHPAASSPEVRGRMQAQRRRDTACELEVRSLLHRLGQRYRVDARPLPDWRRRADLVFTRSRVAVFIDGCFWHGCPDHGSIPKANRGWWEAKLGRNRERDAETDRILAAEGWVVVRVWEHEDPTDAAERIAAVVRDRAS